MTCSSIAFLINFLRTERVTLIKKSTVCQAKLPEPYQKFSVCDVAKAVYALENYNSAAVRIKYDCMNARIIPLSAFS